MIRQQAVRRKGRGQVSCRGAGYGRTGFVGLFIVWLLAAAAGAATLAPEERLQFADGLYARGMYDVASKEYGSFLEDFPDSPKADVAHFRLGECYRQMGNLPAAERHFRKVFTDYPKSDFRLRAGFRRADLFMEIEQYADASALFRVVLGEEPPDAIASASEFFLAVAESRLGKRGEAVRIFERVISRYPETKFCSYALLKLGEILSRPGAEDAAGAEEAPRDPVRALSLFEKAAATPASDRVAAEALYQMAELHFRQGDFEKSAAAYRKLLNSYPEDERCADARLRSTWAAHNAGLFAEALERADAALEQTLPDDDAAEWLYLKANCERQLLKHETAAATYGRLLERYPASEFANAARYEVALTSYKRGEFDAAIAQALKVEPDSKLKKDVYWLLAESFAALKQRDQAIQYYRLLIRDFPDSGLTRDAAFRLAHQLQSQGEFQEASRYYLDVASRFPDSDMAAQSLFASAVCLSKAEMDAEAVRDWARLVTDYGESPLVEQTLYQKAMGEIRLGREADALGSLNTLLKRFPDTRFAADAHYWTGILLHAQDKQHDAEAAFRRCLESKPRVEVQRDAQLHLGQILYETGRFQEAADLFRPLLSSPLIDKFPPSLLQWLAEYDLQQEEWDGSAEAAKTLLETQKDAVWQQTALGLLGRAELARGNKEKAEVHFKACLGGKAMTPFAAEAALRLGDLAFDRKNLEQAASYFERAASIADSESLLGVRARAYVGLAKAAEARGENGAAARYYMSVAILYDDDELVPPSLYKAAAAFRRMGRAEEAEKALQELRERYPESSWAVRPAQDAGDTPAQP